MVKNLPAVQETWVWSLGGEGPLEKETATHSSILAWEIPWMEEPGRLQSMGLHTTEQPTLTYSFSTKENRRGRNFILCWVPHWEHDLFKPEPHPRPAPGGEPYCFCFTDDIRPFITLTLSGFSRVQLFVTPWTAAHQAPLSMEFSRQEPCPPPGDLPNPGLEPMSLMSPALTGEFFTARENW